MKQTGMRTLKSCVSLLLVLCMILSCMPMTALAAGVESAKPIVYVSIGDSMTNGYCLDGYDGSSGAVNYGIETYSNKFAAWLAGYTGSIANDQVIFEGTNCTVDHRQLAISGMRAQDIQWILNLNYADHELMQEVFDSDYNGTGWNESTWYDTWKFCGDRFTWSEYCDYDYRYADAAARILSVYRDNGTGAASAFRSGYADAGTIEKAVAGIAADPYYPQGKEQASEMGGYKYLQVATEFYQKSMEEADVISLAVGNTNFGTHMLSNITDVIMGGDMSFSQEYSIDRVKALYEGNEFVTAQVNEMLTSEAYAKIAEKCTYLAGNNEDYKEEIEYILEYCMTHFIVGYIGMLDTILEMNPDAEIIQVALMNAYAGKDENGNSVINENTLGELVKIIYTPVNAFIEAVPAALIASKENPENYANANVYYAEADYVSCMVDVFGDDYYTKDGSAVTYPGLLTGTEGYDANTSSIVRDRFAEEILCGDMIFAAMGLKKRNTQENIAHFLYGGAVLDTNGNTVYDGVGAVAYDMMTLTEKAAYAAQNADAAKEYALYLAFENSLIRSGTEDVTLDALAGLANIQTAFAAFYPEVMAAIGAARADYYEAAAPVIVASSDGALTEEQVVSIMEAYEQVKAAVWNDFADYHETLKSEYGHSTIEHVINCDTCMEDGGHDDELTAELVATYKDQMDLLPYTIVAQSIEEQTGGLLTGEDVRKLCKTADTEAYTAAVYEIVIAKANEMGYTFTNEDVDLLLEEDGEYKVAGKMSGNDPDNVKMAYESNIILTDEQRAAIEMLRKVRDGVLLLLNGETEPQLKNSAAGIKAAIDGAAQLAYLLALPQTMSDELYNDTNMRGALCMDARCLLGTGAGGHPSVGGHTALYNTILNVFNNVSYEWSEDYSTCTASLNGRFPATAASNGEVTTPATCQTMGTTTYTAKFDVTWANTQTKSVQNIPTSDHVFGEWTVTTAPTCTEDGVKTRICTFDCGETETQPVAAGHSYEPAVTAPTCTEGGYTTYTCSGCDDFYIADETPSTGHSFGEWTQTKAPTCTEPGEEARACACGEIETQSVAALGHSYEPAVTAPTCTEGGYTTYTCATCSDSYITDETSSTGHSYGEDGKCSACSEADPNAHPACEYTVSETLTSGGTYILSLGGTQVGSYTFNQVDGGWTIQAADGTYMAIEDETLVNSASAFTWTYSNGSFSAVVETESSGNNWFGGFFGGWWGSSSSEETYYLVSSGSGVGISTGSTGSDAAFYTTHTDVSHNFNDGTVTAPTCTEGGYTTYTCDRCGYSYTGSYTEALGHSYEAVSTAPTCTEGGYTTYTCDRCDDSYVDNYTEALGHNYVDGICTTCGHDTNEPEIPVEPEEGECTYLAEQTLTSGGIYILTLGGTQVGSYTFTQVDGGWAIQTADGAFLALEDSTLTTSADAFAWTYSNNRFSAETESSSSSSNSWFGGIFGNWWGSSSSTETYYLVASGSSVSVSTSSTNASAKFYQEVTGEHVYGDPVADNGSHVYTCINCGNEMAETCTDPDCELCNPVVPEATINVSVDVSSSSSSSNWWGGMFGNWWGSGSTTYTATITVEAEGTEVESVAYSTDGGSTWTEGTSFESSTEITAFDIRVEATNGVTYFFTYSNGTVTQVG